ncbi:MAG: ParB/RepB/Spo0J family partition protein [Pyrinomonadaceae bacterium]|nr:ParB/RepB/Spo0J family partition protein [Pyrinomonadaceae bacterium]
MRHDFHYVEELSKSQRSIGRVISIDSIEPNPEQPRIEFGDLTGLVESIRAKGVLEPLLVKPIKSTKRWLIIAGERRWRAAQLAGLTEVPCIELDIDEAEVAEIALIENLQRKDLTVWEESDALASLSQRYSYTHEDISRRIGRSRSTVTESLTIAALPREIRERCRELEVNTKSVLLQIARQFDENAMNSFLDQIESERTSSNEQLRISTSDIATTQEEANDTNIPNSMFDSNPVIGSDKPVIIAKKSVSIVSADLPSSYPIKNFNFVSNENDSRLTLKFKKPVDKDSLIDFLNKIVKELQNQ